MPSKPIVNMAQRVGAWYGDMLECFTDTPTENYHYTDLESAWACALKETEGIHEADRRHFERGWYFGRIARALGRLNDLRVYSDAETLPDLARAVEEFVDSIDTTRRES